MIYTTLNDLHKHDPCADRWSQALTLLGKTAPDAEPIAFGDILDHMGLDDALWCLRALPAEYNNAVWLLACDLVEPAMQYTTDPRPAEVLRIARLHARGLATDAELLNARVAALDALDARDAICIARGVERAAWVAIWDVARPAPRVARVAVWVTRPAPRVARDAIWIARDVAWDALWVARDAIWIARDVAWVATRAEQEKVFRAWLDEYEGLK